MTSRPAKRTSPPGRSAAARQPDREPATEPAAPEQDAAPAHRAGGYVDRGDGRGWVLDEEG